MRWDLLFEAYRRVEKADIGKGRIKVYRPNEKQASPMDM